MSEKNSTPAPLPRPLPRPL